MDPGLRAPLAEMQRQTRRMNGIVNDLLELSRLDAMSEEAAAARWMWRQSVPCCARMCWRALCIRKYPCRC